MFYRRWLRFLPDLSQFLLLVGLLAVIVGAISFGNLWVTKSAALARREHARQQLEALREQQQLLWNDLERAQKGYNVPPLAYQYFGLIRKGEIIFEAETPPTPEPAGVKKRVQPLGQPSWLERLEQLLKP